MTTQATVPGFTTAPPPYRAPHDPARVPELVEALKKVTPLQDLEQVEYEWLATHGTEVFAESGAVMFREGDPARKMTILLKGEIYVRREHGGPAALFIGRSGHVTGLLPFSRMKAYGGLGYTSAPTWMLEFDKSLFPEMLRAIPALTERVVGVLLDRVREITRMEQQSEKLNALGKLAGNLAHELNNPASAAQRSAAGVLEELRVYGHERFNLGRLCLSIENTERVQAWEDHVRGEAKRLGTPAESEQTRREDEIVQWLLKHDIQESWHIAPELAEFGVMPNQLEELAGYLNPGAIAVVLSQFTSSLRTERIAEAMLDSTARIFDLIRAIKDYSYMDQMPIQEVDIPQSLENTLAMVGSRLGKVRVVREYEPNLPLVSAYGRELNQVWTSLIENALDAIHDEGEVKLLARTAADMLLVEVWDNGPGIPPELQARIFEPFFTTKAPGSGLGLGLDVVTRIVRMHRGYVTVQSKPGSTCFQVRLPLQAGQAY
ncbi:MAG TPA: ATP-binding protein [Acidobacteriaceae bacterium]|nr:ATP-binding protein [Acidobacteriaceae bacterium]